jgi:hypothetical protein
MAVASLILGLLSLIAWFFPIAGVPVAIAGIVTGIIGVSTANPGLAGVGIALSSIGLIAGIANAAIGGYRGARKEMERQKLEGSVEALLSRSDREKKLENTLLEIDKKKLKL